MPAGLELFLEFAADVDAITPEHRSDFGARALLAFTSAAGIQVKYQNAADPALRFLALLSVAIREGRAHVADRGGRAPSQPEIWGWRAGESLVPAGVRVGWRDGEDLFLDPAASYRAAQDLAGRERLPFSEQTLRQRLAERGILKGRRHGDAQPPAATQRVRSRLEIAHRGVPGFLWDLQGRARCT